MLDEFYLCGLTYSALENARVHHENLCHHVIKKKQAESYFGMRAGLRNNEFCLRGLSLVFFWTVRILVGFSSGN